MTTRDTIAPPAQKGTGPSLTVSSVVPPRITAMMMYGTRSAACTAKISVPMTSSVTGMMRAEDDAISPYVTMPLAKAWPEAPRIEKAGMLVPTGDRRKTVAPRPRPARNIVFGVRRAGPGAEGKDADAEHERQIGEDDHCWNHLREAAPGSSWEGQISRMTTQSTTDIATVNTA
jgi:hypothetical protein